MHQGGDRSCLVSYIQYTGDQSACCLGLCFVNSGVSLPQQWL